jgi:hypothetical protein
VVDRLVGQPQCHHVAHTCSAGTPSASQNSTSYWFVRDERLDRGQGVDVGQRPGQPADLGVDPELGQLVVTDLGEQQFGGRCGLPLGQLTRSSTCRSPDVGASTTPRQ